MRSLIAAAFAASIVFTSANGQERVSADELCANLPVGEPVAFGGTRYTVGEYDQVRRCRNARLAELQEVLAVAGLDCSATEVLEGRCSIDTIVDAPPQMVVPGADAAAQIDALDRMIETLSEGIVAE